MNVTSMPEYNSWSAMIRRCESPNSNEYHRYGARGIAVCDRWRRSFLDFLSDVGPRPSKSHSIDRTDNNIGYEPGNIRWATKKEQARNRRTSRMVDIEGVTKTLAEWSEISGINAMTIKDRLNYGWPSKRAVFHKPWSGGATGVKGVYRKRDRFQAKNYKTGKSLGCFDTIEEATAAVERVI